MDMVVEFDLSPQDVADITGMLRNRLRFAVFGSLYVILGLIAIVSGNKSTGALAVPLIAFGVFVLLIGVLFIAGATQARKTVASLGTRLCGPTKVEVSQDGFHYTGANTGETVTWSRVAYVIERPKMWAVKVAPSGQYFIPKSAVPVERHEALRVLLRQAKKFKTVKR